MTSTGLTIVGLMLNCLGTTLLFIFGVPGVLSAYAKYTYFYPDAVVSARQLNVRRRLSVWGSSLGLVLILAGNILEIVALR